jgi:3-hydroxyisobutyrate dehydrogenase-like beta-hydroxyacid dehydrogenase
VLGLGAIGAALVERLHHRNQKVFVFAKEGWKCPSELRNASVHEQQTALDVVTHADVIFGCAGEDVLTDSSVFEFFSGKWFASCGSMDSEFATLLQPTVKGTPKLQRRHNPFSTVTIPAGGGFAYILNGGFPVNFDRRWDSVRLERIQLTRAFMHAAVLQALDNSAPKTGLVDLTFLSDAKDIQKLSDYLGFKLEEL